MPARTRGYVEAGRRRSRHRGLDLQHAAPGVAQLLGQVEGREDLAHLLAGDVVPAVVPHGVAQQVRDGPGALLRGALAQDVAQLLGGDLRVRKEVEQLVSAAVTTRSLHRLSV